MDNVECVCAALSDEPATLRMHVSKGGFDAWNSLAGELMGGDYETVYVPCLTWAKVAESDPTFAERVTLFKIDVEGWEPQVLQGASSQFVQGNAPVLLVEFTPANAIAAGRSTQQLFAQIENMGFKLYLYDSFQNALVRQLQAPDSEFCNLIAVHPRSAIASHVYQRFAVRE